MEDSALTLTTKPGASLRISVHPGQPTEQNPLSDTLVVFLNGLALPRSAWSSTVEQLVYLRKEAKRPLPALLSYDRYGQGDSDPDPADPADDDEPYGHDLRASAADLHQLLTQLTPAVLNNLPLESARLILVCNSIGCALARLYAASASASASGPCGVAGYLFLDSMMANTDFVSLFPDPDARGPALDPDGLPPGVSADDLRHARARFRDFFHPSVPNAERLDRRRLRELLPHADRPALPDGPGGRAPRLVVVGHDWDEFAEQSEKGSLSVSKSVINAYVNPALGSYNEGLTRLVKNDGSPGVGNVKIAKGCGHFIQKDDPAFVANEISRLLDELQNGK
ncbi:AB hydrolase-1 domain-containing protein [Madurella fahalii]|uniref:AB hydrolase-1 domain-containing protein n=1 Tax=Madurella fahalii TaxID=1157608 RepID=A0ABQ0GT12_9PEZI